MKILFDNGRYDMRPLHGPKVWPWWKPFTLSLYRLDINKPSIAWRLWVYWRGGAAFYDAYLDRRPA